MVRFYVIVGGLLVTLILAAFIGPSFVDWTQYRERFEAAATRALGQPVEVRGDASARLLPFPSITFGEVVVAGEDGGEALLEVENFAMNLELAPFLRGEYLIFDMRLDRPKLRLRTDEAGRLLWPPGTRGLDPEAVSIEKLSIANGSITFADDGTGRSYEVADVNMEVTGASLVGPWAAIGSASVGGLTYEIDAATGLYEPTLRPGVRLRAAIDGEALRAPVSLAGTAVLDDGQFEYVGEFQSQGPAEAPYALTGQFEIGPRTVAVEEYRMAVGERDDPYVITGRAALDLGTEPDFDLVLRGQRLEASQLADTEAEAGFAGEGFGERLQAFARLLSALPSPGLDGQVDVALPAIVSGATTARDLRVVARADEGAWRLDRFSVALPGRTSVEASGTFGTDAENLFDGRITIASRQPTGLATWLGNEVDEALRETGSIGLEGDISVRPDAMTLRDATIALGGRRIQADVDASFVEDARLSATLRGDRIDLMPSLAAATALGAGADADGRSTAIALDLAFEEVIDADLTARNVTARLEIDGGTANIEALDIGELAGARVTLSGVVSLDGERASELAVVVGSETPGSFARVLDRRFDAEWTELLADRADILGPLELTADLAWLEADAPIGFEAAGRLGPTSWSGGGSFERPAGGETYEPGSLALEIETADAALLARQFGLEARATAAPLPVSGMVDYSARAEARRMDVRLEGQPGTLTVTLIDGDPSQVVDIRIEVDRAASLLEMSGLDMPEIAGLPLETHVTASGDGAFWTLVVDELQLGDTLATGRLAGSGQRWQGSVDAGYVPLHRIAGLAFPARYPWGPDSDREFGRPRLPELDLVLAVDARALALGPNLAVEGARMQLAITRERVAVTELQGTVAGGTLEAEGSVRNADGEAFAAARFSLEDGDANALAELLEMARTGGTIDLSGSIETVGKSVAEAIGSATGAGTVTLDDPSIPDLDPLALSRLYETIDATDAAIADDAVATYVAEELSAGPFSPRRIEAALGLGGGTLRIDLEEAADAGSTLAGRIAIDLSSGRLDGETRFTLAVPDDRGRGGDPSVAMALNGTVADPDVEIQVGALTGFLNLRAFEIERDRVAALRAALVETQRLRRETLLFNQQERLERARREEAEQRAAEERRAAELRAAIENARDQPAAPATRSTRPAAQSAPQRGQPLDFDQLQIQ